MSKAQKAQEQPLEQEPTKDKDEKSTDDTKDKATDTKPTKSQITISSELKVKLGNLKANNESFDNVIQRLYDFYGDVNTDNKDNLSFDKIRPELLQTLEHIMPYFNTSYNINSILYNVMCCLVSIEKDGYDDLLYDLYKIVKSINKLSDILEIDKIRNVRGSISPDEFNNLYYKYTREIIDGKINSLNCELPDYEQKVQSLKTKISEYENIRNSIPNQG